MEAVLFIVLLLLYFLPCFIASNRKHPQTAPIIILTLFGGWTGVLWVACLAWSLCGLKKDEKVLEQNK